MSAKRKARPRDWRPLAISAVIAALLLWAFYRLAADFALITGVDVLDMRVSALVQAWRTPVLTVVFKAFTAVGNTTTMIVLTALVAVGLVRRDLRRDASTLIEAVAGGALLASIMKDLAGRSRPLAVTALIKLPTSFSFPSGHAMASLMFFGTLAYLAIRSPRFSPAKKTVSVVACVLAALLVGVSRVYLGVHWPSDVIASWCLGGAWLALVLGWASSERARG